MNLRVKIKCSKKSEENGEFCITFVLPTAPLKDDRITFTGARELSYYTRNEGAFDDVKTEDTFYLGLYKAETNDK